MVTQAFHKIETDGVLSLKIQGENTGPWNLLLYLNLLGKPLYLIGNLCCTCQAMFQGVNYAQLPLTPQQLSHQLQTGISFVSRDIIDTVAAILPKGMYQIGLVTTKPVLVAGQKPPVYTGCQADYYWSGQYTEAPNHGEYEIILPIVPRSDINGNRVAYYKALYKDGREPTALAFSMYDYRVVRGEYYTDILSHFLLDGHHKVMAASQLSRSVTILSFLWMDKLVDLYNDQILRS
jgi:hypothetical protein